MDLIYGPRNGPHNAEDLVLDDLISGQPRVRPQMRTSYVDIACEPEFLDLKCEPRKVDPQISVSFSSFWLNYANWFFFPFPKWLKKCGFSRFSKSQIFKKKSGKNPSYFLYWVLACSQKNAKDE